MKTCVTPKSTGILDWIGFGTAPKEEVAELPPSSAIDYVTTGVLCSLGPKLNAALVDKALAILFKIVDISGDVKRLVDKQSPQIVDHMINFLVTFLYSKALGGFPEIQTNEMVKGQPRPITHFITLTR